MRFIWNTVLTVGLLTGLTLGLPLAAAAQTFTYGSFVPSTDYLNTDTLPVVFAELEDNSDGEVKWDLIVGGQLADGVSTFPAVEDRLMEGGLAAPFFSPSSMPNIAFLYSIVVSTEDVVALTGAAVETTFLDCPGCMDDAKRMNSIPFGGFSGSPVLLMCSKPVSSLDDIRKMRVRANGGIGDLVSGAGASQVAMTLAESVTVLQRGGIECVVGAADWLATYGYGEKAKFVLQEPLGMYAPVIGLLMNRDAFHELSAKGQEATLRASARLTAIHSVGNFIVQTAETLADQIANNGIQIVPVADDLRDYIRAFPTSDRANRIKAGKALGIGDPEALMDAYAKNFEKWKALSASIGTDTDAFTQALWDEVFSKVDPKSL